MKRGVILAGAAACALATCGDATTARQGELSEQGRDASQSAAAIEVRLAAPGDVTQERLRAAVSDAQVRSFYEAQGWRPIWTAEMAAALVGTLDDAGRHGLERSMFIGDIGEVSDAAAREAEPTKVALDYADALANGRTDPDEIRDVYTVPWPGTAVAAGLNQAVESGHIAEWLNGLAPADPAYRALSDAHLRFREQAAREQSRSIAGGAAIHAGESDPRVPQIAQALGANGYIAAPSGPADTYTEEMAAAVRRLQSDYGIAVDGIVGPDTLEVLNTGAADRARQLAVNLERLRWLEREPPATRIDVNTAAAHLDYWRDGHHADRRKVVVGQPGWETPQLGSPIFRLVANPTWTVPKSIEEEEIAHQGSAYLRRNNMVRRGGWIVQLPGPGNALGEVKFDMRNNQSIYLHDTPSKQLFDRNERHLSHGCVRVEDALGFARLIADHDGKRAQFEEALASGDETFVDLQSNIPVRLLYHTAFADPQGKVIFRTDPYGWDEDVAEALGLEREARRTARVHNSDVGP